MVAAADVTGPITEADVGIGTSGREREVGRTTAIWSCPRERRAMRRTVNPGDGAPRSFGSGGGEVGAVPYDCIELARYTSIPRYLMALLSRHRGSVTDAARAAT